MNAFVEVMQEEGINDLDFDRAFRTWELQRGYPLITVSHNIQSQAFEITQERFFAATNTNTDESSWYIPLNFATSSSSNFDDTSITDYFVDGETTKQISTSASAAFDWYVFNKQQLGFYRVNYDEANWNAIVTALNSEAYADIHVLNRAQLIDDSIAFATLGLTDYTLSMDLIAYLFYETEYTPFSAADRLISDAYTGFGTQNSKLNVSRRTASSILN